MSKRAMQGTLRSEGASVLRLPTVMARTGLSRSTIYDHISKSTFPKQIKLGPRVSGWLEADIDKWLEDRIKLSRKNAA